MKFTKGQHYVFENPFFLTKFVMDFDPLAANSHLTYGWLADAEVEKEIDQIKRSKHFQHFDITRPHLHPNTFSIVL